MEENFQWEAQVAEGIASSRGCVALGASRNSQLEASPGHPVERPTQRSSQAGECSSVGERLLSMNKALG